MTVTSDMKDLQANAIVSLVGVVGSQGNGLRTLSVGVLDVNVVDSDVLSLDDHGTSGLIIAGTAGQAGRVLDSHRVATVVAGVLGLTIDGQTSAGGRGDGHLLGVGTGVDKDRRSRAGIRDGVDGILDSGVVTTRVADRSAAAGGRGAGSAAGRG